MKKLRSTDVTTAEFARFINRSMRWVQKMIQDEQIPKPDKNGRIKTWPAIHSYITTLQDALKAGGSEAADITAARSRLELARAEEKELEVARLKGQVVLADDVEAAWLNLVSNFRARLLSLPTTLAAQGDSLPRAELLIVATKLVEKTLKELSEMEIIDEPEPDIKPNSKPSKAKNNRKTGSGKRKTTAKTDSK